MHALLLIAHGSRVQDSNLEIARLCSKLAQYSAAHGSNYQVVRHAFLELAEPSIPFVIDGLVADGASAITILPYFLAAGRHVGEDIPNIVKAKRQQYRQLKLVQAAHLGTAEQLIPILFTLAMQT